MDIENLFTVEAHESGAEMQVKDENGNDLDMFITVAGLDSKVFRAALVAVKRKFIEENAADADAETLAEATLGWRGFMSDGKELEFSKEKIKDLYINAPYIKTQVNFFIGNRANFTKG